MLERLDVRGAGDDLRWRLPRPQAATEPPVAEVQAILAQVREGGDAAVRELTERFDGVAIDELAVPAAELGAALSGLEPQLRAALEAARDNIRDYHEAQVTPEV
ncbi:MAG: histidinol dehydrogenase, partial [Actinomycetota bacterium]|nr:histidinol dehydrogenase [Actinomycetota bacterium]